tara:strand:- start:43024 stop:44646 length:1623 start_codon:yes stop_codon:yes gene_type:complete
VRTAPAASQDPISDDEVVQRASHGASEQIKVANRARRSTSPQRSGQVRQVGHQVGVLPAPPSNGPVSIVQSAPTPIPHGSVTLDGQVVSDSVVYESVGAPIYDGSVMSYGGVACDAMPGAGCGCDSPVCTGGCDAMGCDSMGCSGGTCGGKDCSMCGELASGPAWRPAVTIRLPQDGWFSYEYLSWWQDGMALPPLITTSPQGTQRAQAGVLGQTGTTTLFGDGDVLDDSIDGVRLNFGFWFDRCHTMGLGADYFNIGSETETFTATSTGNPILARPFFNTLTGLNDAELVAFTGAVDGTVTARATSELHGGGFYFRRLRCCDEGCTGGWICGCSSAFCSRTEARVGYRYLQLDESLTITEDLTSTDTANPGTFDIMDRFDTRNQFNGFDLGWSYRRVRDYWTCDVLLKLAIGNTHQIVTIDGTTTTNDPTDPPTVTRTGGLLAQVSNIGEYENDEFAVVPEFNLNIGYQMTDHFRLMAGYTAIYWSNVVRPGDQISLDLNTDQLPPEAEPVTGIRRPTFAFRTSDYWIQGINFGGEYRW